MLFTPAQIKTKSFELFFFSFLPGVDASHVYVRARALGCFTVLTVPKLQALVYDILPSLEESAGKRRSECDQYRNLSEGADPVGGQLRGDKECPFNGVTKSGRVWRKVPESDARSVPVRLTVH